MPLLEQGQGTVWTSVAMHSWVKVLTSLGWTVTSPGLLGVLKT